ncbi:MAG: hypothetical protein IIA83_07995 [Thaumarchaeota archaeon]|nr:hypothetical protein [Nitrososphaerota archaeon]
MTTDSEKLDKIVSDLVLIKEKQDKLLTDNELIKKTLKIVPDRETSITNSESSISEYEKFLKKELRQNLTQVLDLLFEVDLKIQDFNEKFLSCFFET